MEQGALSIKIFVPFLNWFVEIFILSKKTNELLLIDAIVTSCYKTS
jgi:hypothetical protein